MNWKAKNLPFYAFIIGFFLIMIAPYLLSHGMFMDGIMYATVSNNLANGIGSMSDLLFTDTSIAHFREHPPLAFWIQSLFYKVFGDSFIIEKLYSALTYVITGLIIRKIWIRLTGQKSLAWLPLLFWISIPIITQAARNNLLENTLMIFTTTALYFLIKDKSKPTLLSLAIAGFAIYLGFMTKGFVALFIWSFPFWSYIIRYNNSFVDGSKHTFLLIAFTLIPFTIVSLIYPESYEYLKAYFDIQVSNSLQHVQTVDSRFWIIKKLFKELITPGILIFLILLFSRFSGYTRSEKQDHKMAWLLLMVGLSGVFPIMISLKQNGFYSIPAFAILSISFALFLKDKMLWLYHKINSEHIGFKVYKYITVLGIFVGLIITISNYDKNGRDADKLDDIEKIAAVVDDHFYLDGSFQIPKDWTVAAYFYRYHKINIVPTERPENKYYLSLGVLKDDLVGYTPIDLNLSYFKLYEQN